MPNSEFPIPGWQGIAEHPAGIEFAFQFETLGGHRVCRLKLAKPRCAAKSIDWTENSETALGERAVREKCNGRTVQTGMRTFNSSK